MAVDRGYGSGKPRSAANSRARQRVAAGQMTKGKKGNAALKKIAAENPVTGFIGGGVGIAKLGRVAAGLYKAGKFKAAEAVEARLGAKTIGRNIPKNYSYFPKGLASGPGTVEGKLRSASTSVFPRGTDLAKRALKAKSETRTAIRESMNYEFPFNRVVNEAERIERKYGLTQRTAEEGLRQAGRRIKPRKSGGR